MRPGLPRQAGFNVPLNGYRGLCALFVFVYHVANAGVIPLSDFQPAAAFVFSSFRYGVEMFFMISGFVIPISLARHATLRGFLRDRFIRIYSAWVPILIVVTLVCLAFNLKMFADATPLHASLLFVANLFLLPPLVPVTLVVAGSWSLTYEWVFYFAGATRRSLQRLVGASHHVAIIAWALAVTAFVALFPRALFFVPGVLAFRYAPWFAQHKGWLRGSWISLVVFLIAWRFTGADKAELIETMFDWAQDGRWVAALVALVAAIHLFGGITVRASSGFAFLESRAFQFLGNVSYSFYLWQSLVVSLVKRVAGKLIIPHVGPAFGVVAVFVIGLAIAVPLAWATWLFLEVRLAKRMHAWLEPAAPPLTEAQEDEALSRQRAVSFTT